MMLGLSAVDSLGDLKLPEVLLKVLHYVDHPATLASCACVNRLWYDEAIHWLWKGSPSFNKDKWSTPDIKWLCRIARDAPQRCTDYIRHIRHLRLHYDDFKKAPAWEEMLPLWQSSMWDGAALVTVHVRKPGLMGLMNMALLLGEDLLVLKMSSGDYGREFFQCLQKKAPRLKWLAMKNRWKAILPEHLIGYLHAQPNIEVFDLKSDHSSAVNSEVIQLLSELRQLKHLRLGFYAAPVTSDIVLRSSHGFSSLQSLELYELSIDAFSEIVASAPSLRRIGVLMHPFQGSNGSRFFRSLASLSLLEELSLDFHGDTKYSLRDFCAFAQACPKLRQVHLGMEHDERDPSPGLPGFGSILSHWPLLEYLDLGLTHNDGAGVQYLASIGQWCPLLKWLRLDVTLDVTKFDEPQHVHPLKCLERLDCTQLVARGVFIVDSTMLGIDKMMPCLEWLRCDRREHRSDQIRDEIFTQLQALRKIADPGKEASWCSLPSIVDDLQISILDAS